jgi:WD40 repeat protein
VYAPSSSGGEDHLLWVERGRLLARKFDAKSGTVSGGTSEIGGPVRVHDSQRGAFLSVSNEGTIAFSSPGLDPPRLTMLDRKGNTLQTLELSGNDQFEPVLSPDGRLLAFVSVTGGVGSIWLYDFERKTSSPLTMGSGYSENIAWSPDGREIAYGHVSSTTQQPMRMKISSRAAVPLAKAPAGRFGPVVWTPGGFVVGRLEEGQRSIVAAISTTNPQEIIELTKDGRSNGLMSLSSDGQWLAYGIEMNGLSDVFVARVQEDGESISLGEPQLLPLRNVENAVWTRKGAELLAYADDRCFYSIPAEYEDGRLRLGTPVKLFRVLLEQAKFNAAPDGEQIVAKVDANATREAIRLVVNWEERLSAPLASRRTSP